MSLQNCERCGKPMGQPLGRMTTARCLCAYGDLVEISSCPVCGAELVTMGEEVAHCAACDEVLFRSSG